MTDVTNSRPARRRRISRLPAFTPVLLRGRKDGWTPLRQTEFLGMLAETRSVSAAAAFVGMSRESAYRLRRKPGARNWLSGKKRTFGELGRRSPRVTFNPPQTSLRPLIRPTRGDL